MSLKARARKWVHLNLKYCTVISLQGQVETS